MASKSARKRRKRRPPPPPPTAASEPEVEPEAKPKVASARRRDLDERPPAPWGNFPLVELAVLSGLIMLIAGFVVGGDRGPILIAAGLALGSIGGLDLSIREHFAGYQSHTLILAGVPALIVLAFLFYVGPDGLPPVARGAIALAVFGVAAFLLSRAFSRRSSGLRYKVRPLRAKK